LWRGLDYGELRRRVGMREVLSLLQWQPVAARGPQLRGPCPLHPSSSPHSRSFSVHLEKGAFRCFGCGKQGNQLDLFAQTTGQPLYAAALELCRRLGVEPPFSPRAMSAPARSD
jgi:DNA primase